MISYETALATFKEVSTKAGRPWIDCPEQAECLEQLIRWAVRDGYNGRYTTGIMLRGHRDTGKTHAMKTLAGMLRALHGSSRGAPFDTRICQDLVKQYNLEGDAAFHDMCKGDRVLYDDLGEEREGNFMSKQCNVMAEVVGDRYRKMQDHSLLTMFTTNIPNDAEMAKRYGERIMTRLNEMCDVIVWKGPKEGFRKKVEPKMWFWPDSPQEKEQTAEERKVRESAWKAKADADLARFNAEKKAKEEKDESDRQARIAKEISEMASHTTSMLTIKVQFAEDKEVKDAARREIANRTSLPVEDVILAANNPIPIPAIETEQ